MKQISLGLIIFLAVASQMVSAQTQKATQDTPDSVTSAPPESAAPPLMAPSIPVSQVEPEYPPSARQARVEGYVRLRVPIAAGGHVEHIGVLRSHPLPARAAMAAVEQWQNAALPATGPTEVGVPFSLTDSAPADPPQRIILKEADQAAKLVSGPPPVYPAEARAAGIEGDVVLKIVVGKDGHVLSAEVVSGNSALTSAAVDSVKARVYRQTLLNGAPVEVSTVATVPFRLK